MNAFEALHERAHQQYIDDFFKEDVEGCFWGLMDRVAENWRAEGMPGTFKEYVYEHGCPEEKLFSRKVFLLNLYHTIDWALYTLSVEDLALWAQEEGLDLHTLIDYKELL